MANNNTALGAAKKAKQDEFYTQLTDIEQELKHYRQHFKNKTVLCNCDDPFESNFFKYFVLNFNKLGLKKLIATSYATSPIAGTQFSYHIDENGQMSFSFGGNKDNTPLKKAYKAVVNTVYDKTGNDAVEMLDVAELFESGENKLTELDGDGDFRSAECIKLLREADIVVTNPPFSLFREYVAQLMEYDKQFLIIGNQSAIHYKDFFPLLKDDKIWIGVSIHNGDREFRVPNNYNVSKNYRFDENGYKYVRVRGPRWFTNLDIKQHHEELILVQKYSSERYPKYANYDAIEVGKTADIPCDYSGAMGVPDTFMDKYSPDQFEIIGLSNVNGLLDGVGIIGQKWIDDYRAAGGTGHITANMHSLVAYTTDGKPVSYYSRIIIRNKHPEQPKEA